MAPGFLEEHGGIEGFVGRAAETPGRVIDGGIPPQYVKDRSGDLPLKAVRRLVVAAPVYIIRFAGCPV